jgi:hypothetical protein
MAATVIVELVVRTAEPMNGVGPVVLAARETHRRLAYDRKFAAENHVSALKLVGPAKRFLRAFSESIRILWPIGPQRNTPAKAPSDVATAGTTVVRSISETLTPGDSWKAIFIFSLLRELGVLIFQYIY